MTRIWSKPILAGTSYVVILISWQLSSFARKTQQDCFVCCCRYPFRNPRMIKSTKFFSSSVHLPFRVTGLDDCCFCLPLLPLPLSPVCDPVFDLGLVHDSRCFWQGIDEWGQVPSIAYSHGSMHMVHLNVVHQEIHYNWWIVLFIFATDFGHGSTIGSVRWQAWYMNSV